MKIRMPLLACFVLALGTLAGAQVTSQRLTRLARKRINFEALVAARA